MTSIISIAVGKCGISIQEQQWITLLAEQGLDYSGNATPQNFEQNIEAYFSEVKQNIYKPRSMLLDLDDQQINNLECGKLKQLFMGIQTVTSKQGSNNIFARGMFTIGENLKDEIENSLRYLSEQCDKIDSIQIQRSICGGSGSGLGSVIHNIACEMLCSKTIINSLIHFPDVEDLNELTIEIYNMILANLHIYNESDIVLPFCNQNIQSLIDNSISLMRERNFEGINSFISQIHPNITCSIRYQGSQNASTRKICTNIIPYPRQKYMTLSYLPYNYYKPLSADIEYKDMINSFVDEKYFLFNKQLPKILSAHHIFRGTSIHEGEIEREVFQKYQQTNVKKTAWIPNSFSIQYCNTPTLHNNKSLLSIINNRMVCTNFQKYAEKFTTLFKKKAFLHHYLQEGMDELEFSESQTQLYDLIAEHIQWGYDAPVYDDIYGEYEDNEELFI